MLKSWAGLLVWLSAWAAYRIQFVTAGHCGHTSHRAEAGYYAQQWMEPQSWIHTAQDPCVAHWPGIQIRQNCQLSFLGRQAHLLSSADGQSCWLVPAQSPLHTGTWFAKT